MLADQSRAKRRRQQTLIMAGRSYFAISSQLNSQNSFCGGRKESGKKERDQKTTHRKGKETTRTNGIRVEADVVLAVNVAAVVSEPDVVSSLDKDVL